MRAYRLPVRGRIKAIGECALHTMTEPLIQQSGRQSLRVRRFLSGMPYERFVGSAFIAVGRDDPGAPLWKSVRGSAHITYSLFTIHRSLKNMNCLRSRHISHSPLALSP